MASKPLSLLNQRPWLRLGGHETERAYEAFIVYRDMPQRSLHAVAEELNHNDSLVKHWSRKYGWVDRALSWDQHRQQVRDNARERATIKALERNAMIGDSLAGFGYDQLKRLAKQTMHMPDDKPLLTAREALLVMKSGLEIEAKALGLEGPTQGEVVDDAVDQILERAVDELAQVLPDVAGDTGEVINMPDPSVPEVSS